MSHLKSYWAEIRNLSWLPPKVLLAPILVALWPSLILVFFSYFLFVMFFLTPELAPKAGPCHLYLLFLEHIVMKYKPCIKANLLIKISRILGRWGLKTPQTSLPQGTKRRTVTLLIWIILLLNDRRWIVNIIIWMVEFNEINIH